MTFVLFVFQAMSDDSTESEKILRKAESKPWWLEDDDSDNEIGDLNCFLIRFVFSLLGCQLHS